MSPIRGYAGFPPPRACCDRAFREIGAEMNQILPIVLIGIGGFLIGGVLSFRQKSVPVAVLFGVFSAGCILGGVLWLVGISG